MVLELVEGAGVLGSPGTPVIASLVFPASEEPEP